MSPARKRGAHRTLPLLTCCGYMADIDVAIIPVVSALWDLGIHTSFSCQGDPGRDASVLFPSSEEVDRFIMFIWAGLDDHDGPWGTGPFDDWKWTFCLRGALLASLVKVEFPHAQLEDVARWLKQGASCAPPDAFPPRQLRFPMEAGTLTNDADLPTSDTQPGR